MAYIGQIKVKDGATEVTYPVGSTLYGTCNTAANEPAKVANTGNLAQIDSFTDGLTIHVKFTNSNTAANPTLKINTLDAKPIITYGESTPGTTASASWQAGAIVSFTYDGTSWVMNTGVDLNSASSVISGLNATITGMAANKTLKTLGETNGIINATFENIILPESQVTNLVSDLAAKAPLNGPVFTGTPQLTTTPTSGDNSNKIADTAFVTSAINNAISTAFGANDAMVYKGLLDANATETATTKNNVPTSGYSAGWAYRVNRAGTYAGQVCEVGDLVIAVKDGPATGNTILEDDWTVAQNNIDGAVIGPASSTSNHVAIFNDNTGKVIKDSGFTIETSVPANALFTDTHYTAHLLIGTSTSATSIATTTNTNTFLNLIENNTVRDSLQIRGTDVITVTHTAASSQSDSPVLSISAAKFTGTVSGYLEAPGTEAANKFLRGDATWKTLSVSITSSTNTTSTVVTNVSLNQGAFPTLSGGTATKVKVEDGILTITAGNDASLNAGTLPSLETISRATLGIKAE